MLKPFHSKKFQKDLKKITKQRKNLAKLKSVMEDLINEKPLDRKFLDHPLKGDYTDCRECHLEPDWLLIYLIEKPNIKFLRTGSHSELFQ